MTKTSRQHRMVVMGLLVSGLLSTAVSASARGNRVESTGRPEQLTAPERVPIAQQAYLKPTAVGITQVGDAFGVSVAVSGDTLVVGAPLEASSTMGVDSLADESAVDSGAAYVFVRTGSTWSQQAYLKPAAVGTTQAGDRFGWSVAVSGDTVVVGARLENSSTTGVDSLADESAVDSGAAYVFTRTGQTWSQQAYLKPAAVGTTQTGDFFGASVAVSGDTVVVGASSEDSNTTGVDSVADESIRDSGAAYVFTRSGSTWSQEAYLKPAAVGTTQRDDFFGSSVAVSGDTVVVGALGEDSSTMGVDGSADESARESGAAYVFTRSGSTWSQEAYLKPAAVGITQARDFFGFSVAVAGDAVAVGAYLEDSSTTGVDSLADENSLNSGAAYVFTRTGSTWSQEAYLKPAAVGATQMGDFFGGSVAVLGDTVVVGAPFEASSATGVNGAVDEGASESGAAYVFLFNEPCVPGPSTLCLNQGRFKVEATWRDFADQTGSAIDAGLVSDDSGLLWFFTEDNWEMLVKVLDGCDLTQHFWVFAATTTNVEYELTVTDTVTGFAKTYHNGLGVSAPAITDTAAFPTCEVVGPAGGSSPENATAAMPVNAAGRSVMAEPKQGACTAGASALCLNGDRFEVEIEWQDFEGNTGLGQVDGLQSADSGLMWFFSPNNLEVLVKVLDGCAINDRVWVFAAATTDIAYRLRIRDTMTGVTKEYQNRLGNAADAITDTDAFDVCQ